VQLNKPHLSIGTIGHADRGQHMFTRKNIDDLLEACPELAEILDTWDSRMNVRTREIRMVMDMMPDIIFCGPDLFKVKKREMRRNLFNRVSGMKQRTNRVVAPIATCVARRDHRRG